MSNITSAKVMIIDRAGKKSENSSSYLLKERFENNQKNNSYFSVPRTKLIEIRDVIGLIPLLHYPDFDKFPMMPNFDNEQEYIDDATRGFQSLRNILEKSQAKSFEVMLL